MLDLNNFGSKRVIINRFEGDYAVVELENQSTANIEISALPDGAKEGDTVILYIERNDTELQPEKNVSVVLEDILEIGVH